MHTFLAAVIGGLVATFDGTGALVAIVAAGCRVANIPRGIGSLSRSAKLRVQVPSLSRDPKATLTIFPGGIVCGGFEEPWHVVPRWEWT
mmetsp:Transcript_19578/g.45765  ORF Transcript_19578/g.45765 Transcript_19578/m.45765 type:complete len:89 (-) Transcript_19578:76-342(-)